MRFLDKFGKDQDGRNVSLSLVEGKNAEGEVVFAFLAAYPEEVKQFKLDNLFKPADLKRYGIVLYHGKGRPSGAMQAEAKRRFEEMMEKH